MDDYLSVRHDKVPQGSHVRLCGEQPGVINRQIFGYLYRVQPPRVPLVRLISLMVQPSRSLTDTTLIRWACSSFSVCFFLRITRAGFPLVDTRCSLNSLCWLTAEREGRIPIETWFRNVQGWSRCRMSTYSSETIPIFQLAYEQQSWLCCLNVVIQLYLIIYIKRCGLLPSCWVIIVYQTL